MMAMWLDEDDEFDDDDDYVFDNHVVLIRKDKQARHSQCRRRSAGCTCCEACKVLIRSEEVGV